MTDAGKQWQTKPEGALLHCGGDLSGVACLTDEKHTASEVAATLRWLLHLDGYARVVDLVLVHLRQQITQTVY